MSSPTKSSVKLLYAVVVEGEIIRYHAFVMLAVTINSKVPTHPFLQMLKWAQDYVSLHA